MSDVISLPSDPLEDVLAPGQIIATDVNGKVRFLRVLWADPEHLDPAEAWLDSQPQLVAIDVRANDAWPECTPLKKAVTNVTSSLWRAHRDRDPFHYAFQNEGEISEELLDNYRERRERLSRLVHLIADQRPHCFRKDQRTPLIAQAATDHQASPSLVRKWLRLFWQSGEHENSLWPRHGLAGTSTIEEVLREHAVLPKRRGRPVSDAADVRSPDSTIGEQDFALPSREQRDLLLQGFDEYVKENQNKGLISSGRGIPWADARRNVIRRYFETRTRLLPDRRGKPAPTDVETREELLPSIQQFKRLITQNRKMAKIVENLEGTRRFNLLHRQKGGDPRRMALGSGGLYQIDWMLADVYLVNRLTGMPCGRPYVFFVIDTFSRMVVGIHVTFDPPDFRAAAQALINAFSDKGPYCARFGRILKPGEWACAHLCWRLLADNGELARAESDTIVARAVSDLANTPPFRADLKALIENTFRCSNMGTLRWLPGHTRGPRERHAPDPRLQSQLNIDQFTRLLIDWVVDVYNTRVIDKFPRTELMAKYPVATVPNMLWPWGFKHMGRPRKMPTEEIRRRLMPVADATVREDGIWFMNICFLSDEPAVQKLIFKAAQHGNFDLRASYDPHSTDEIELLSIGSSQPPCRVPIGGISSQYAGKTFQEVNMYLEDADALNRTHRRENERKRRINRAEAQETIRAAGSVIAAQHGNLAGRNKLARLSELKSEREKESTTMKQADVRQGKPQPPSPNLPLRPAIAQRLDLRARFAQETRSPSS